MALFVDTSLFYGDIEIPQVSEASVQGLLARYIEKLEPQFLQELFGYEMAAAIKANPNDARFTALKDGGNYNAYGYTRHYRGLKYLLLAGPPAQYLSPIANYVYFHYYRDQQTASTGTGEKVLNANNAVFSSAWSKLRSAWNDMVDINSELIDYVRYNYTVYPEYRIYNPALLRKIGLF